MPRIQDYLGSIDKDYDPNKVYRMNFSIDSTPIEINEVPSTVNFSEDHFLTQFSDFLENFSLLELIRVAKMPPKTVLRRRINEVARYVNSNSVQKVEDNKYTINNYLNNYIFEQIMKLMNDPKVSNINLMYFLNLQLYMKNVTPLRNLQRYLIRSKKSMESSGFLNKQIQTELKKYYSEVWREFITGVESKYITEGKRGILSGSTPQVSSKEELDEMNKLISFSESEFRSIAKVDNFSEFRTKLEIILESDSEKLMDLIKTFLTCNKAYIENNKADITKGLDENKISEDPELTNVIKNILINGDPISKVTEYIDKVSNFSDDSVEDEKSLSDLVTEPIANFSTPISGYIPLNLEWINKISCYLPPFNGFWYKFDGTNNDGKLSLKIYKFPHPKIDYTLRSSDNSIYNDEYIIEDKNFDSEAELTKHITDMANSFYTSDYVQFSESKELEILENTDSLYLAEKIIDEVKVIFFGYRLNNTSWLLTIYKITNKSEFDHIDYPKLLSSKPNYEIKLQSKEELLDVCSKYTII